MTVTLVCGFPASGKTSLVLDSPVYKGWERLNRDLVGGKVNDLLPKLEGLLRGSKKNVIIDNLFLTAEDRKPFIELTTKMGSDVACTWVSTSAEDCQVNACRRLINKWGRVLNPDDFKNKKYKDPNTFPPAPLFKAKKVFEKPTTGEGFSKIDKIPFNRVWGPKYKNKALILDYDGTLRETIGGPLPGIFPVEPEHLRVLPNRTKVLKQFLKMGFRLLGASNQSGIAKGTLTHEQARACFDHTNKLLGVDIEYMYDASRVPPITSWSRKPMPGMGVTFIEKYKLNPSECIMVGDMTSDKTFASRCGFQYVDAKDFFK